MTACLLIVVWLFNEPSELRWRKSIKFKFASLLISQTAQESEDIDDEAHDVFEKTKDVLREALRSRCNRLDTCVQKCPRKKKYTCTLTCKEIIDDYNVCEKPKKNECKKPKCGKTMPPSWLLRK